MVDIRRVLEVTWHVDDAAYPEHPNVTYIGVLDDADVPDADLRGVINVQWGWHHPGPGITLVTIDTAPGPIPDPRYHIPVHVADGDPRSYLYWY